MERSKKVRNFRKSVAFMLVMAMLMSTISFGAGLLGNVEAGKVYAGTTTVSDAVSTTLTGYYGTHENYILDDWEEMVAVIASGGNLEDYILPQTPALGAPSVITSLLRGDTTAAGIAAQNLVTEGMLNTTYYAYGDAFNIIALEAYNKSVEQSDEIVYSTGNAIEMLLAYRTTVGGIENQFYGLDWDTGDEYLDTDGAAMALVAFSLFSEDVSLEAEKIIAVEQAKRTQTDHGDFSGAWGSNANTTAIVTWGLVAAGENINTCYTSLAAIKTPVDGLLSYFVSGGGYGYTNSDTINATATKQASLAMADMNNGYSFYATLSSSAVNYISTEIQVIADDNTYAEKKLTMGNDKTIAKAIQRALSTSAGINYEEYKLYVNGNLEASPSERILQNGDTILAVAKEYTKVAYFKTSDTELMGVNRAQVGFGQSKELMLVERTLAGGTEIPLAGKPLNYGTAMATDYGTTNEDGKVIITPVESGLDYKIIAKRTAWDFNTSSTVVYIDSQTAILPGYITMSKGSPQTEVVSVRIEGPNSNIYHNEAVTVARPDGSRLTVFDAVTQAMSTGSISYVHTNKYITSINGIASGSYSTNHWDGWMYNIIEPDYLDGTSSLTGMGTQFISGGEEIVVYYGNDSMTTFYPIVASKLNSNGSVEIEIKKYEKNWTTNQTSLVSASGITVLWGYTSEGAFTYTDVTNTDGKVIVPAEYALTGQHSLQLSKGAVNLPDVIRLAPDYSVGISSSGTSSGGGGIAASEVSYLTVKGPYGNLISRTSFVWYDGMTPLYILQSSGLRIETDSSGNYVQSVEGVGEFDLGKNSGWLYSVNGVTPTNKASNLYILKANDNVLWYYTLDFTKDSSSSAWVSENQGVTGTDDVLTVGTKVQSSTNSSGVAKASVTTNQLSTAIAEVLKAAGNVDNSDKQTEIKINVDLDDNAASLGTTISKASFGNLVTNKIGMLTIASSLGDISLDLSTLKMIFGKATGDITISITKAEKIDGRPVVDLSVMSAGKKITEFSGVVTVSIPYTLASGEKASGIVMYYVNETGKMMDVKSSSYDESKKTVTFETDHFSKFLIAYHQITFKDIQGHWAQAYIELLANRNIIKGMTETTFVPNGNITRAQFAKMLAGLEGADLSKATTSKFSDVSQNAWYSGAVAWASENNITVGYANADGTKSFNPNQNITRQDMAVMINRYLENIDKSVLNKNDAKIDFADESEIANYAKDAVLKMQQAGMINGKSIKDGKTSFEPLGNLTRAEAAKIIASIVKS